MLRLVTPFPDRRLVATVASLALLASAAVAVAGVEPKAPVSFSGIELVSEFAAPGLESEIAGIYAHPTEPDLYFVAANLHPVYREGQAPMLPERYRGQLLTVRRDGEIVRAFDLVRGDYGGIAFGKGHLFVSSLDPAEVLKVDAESGEVVARFPIAGPAGGLEFDAEKNALYAQIFTGHPHLAVIDADSGETVGTMWSDESAMGLALVGGDLLCTWANSFENEAFSELRLLDRSTGEVEARIALDRVHTSLAPLPSGFLSLVASGEAPGRVVVRQYAYDRSVVRW